MTKYRSENISNQAQARLPWVDLLRLIAIFMVVCVHCSDFFNISPDAKTNPDFAFWGAIYGCFLRPCVPFFVMITGLLLLPINLSTEKFYKKRILRILVPFLIWSVLYNLFPYFVGLFGSNVKVINQFFPYAASPSLTLGYSVRNVLKVFLNFSDYTVHLWYIYMLIGLYLFIPFFSAWIKQATDKQKRIYLAIWFITLFLPYLYEYVSKYIWGTCAWNSFGILYYFAGFNGYLLLGHYMKEHPIQKRAVFVPISIVLFVIGYIATYKGFRHITSLPHTTEEQMELFFQYCSPNVLFMTSAIFMLIQHVTIKDGLVKRLLANLTKCGLGIYMIHYFFVGLWNSILIHTALHLSIRIPVTAACVLACAWIVVAFVYRVVPKFARWVLG